jgi:hypothetical protein
MSDNVLIAIISSSSSVIVTIAGALIVILNSNKRFDDMRDLIKSEIKRVEMGVEMIDDKVVTLSNEVKELRERGERGERRLV